MLLAPAAPIGRVTIEVGADRDGYGACWASLTAAEAHRLAYALLEHGEALNGHA